MRNRINVQLFLLKLLFFTKLKFIMTWNFKVEIPLEISIYLNLLTNMFTIKNVLLHFGYSFTLQ